MNLTETPEIVVWPQSHYLYVETIGPFVDSAGPAWQKLHRYVPEISERNQISGFTSLYKVGPQIYRAGVLLPAAPVEIPHGLKYESFLGGKYSKFVLQGSYAQLPEASRRVFEIVAQTKIKVRDDFYIENYANDPKTTPESQLLTEILVPTI